MEPKPQPRTVSVEKRKPMPNPITIQHFEWKNRRQKLCLVMNDTPYGDLFVMLGEDSSRPGTLIRGIARVPRESDIIIIEHVSFAGIWTAMTPEVFVLKKTPFGRLSFRVEGRNGRAFVSDI